MRSTVRYDGYRLRLATACGVALALLVLVGFGATPATAQAPSTPSDRELDEEPEILGVVEGSDRIALEIALPTSLGRLAPSERNFGVTDGGRQVDVQVSPLDTPSTVLVIDTSGSMRGASLAGAKEAARSFVASSPADVGIGLVSFGETATVHLEPSLDRAGLLAAVDGLTTDGGETALWDALVIAADLLDGGGDERASVVLLSDGGNTAGSASRADAVERLLARSAVLYAVGIDSPEVDFEALEDTVAQVGGQYRSASGIADLDSLYVDIAGRLSNRYRLEFIPAQEGSRRVVVSVASPGGVTTVSTVLTGSPTVARPGVSSTPDDDVGAEAVLGPVAIAGPGPAGDPVLLWVGAGSIFGSITLLVLLIARPPTPVRLATASGADHLAGIKAQLGHAFEQIVVRHDTERRLDRRLDVADVQLKPGEFILVWLLTTGAALALVSAIVGVFFGVLVVPLSVVIAGVVLGARARRRQKKFADQLTEALGIMTSSLRAGQSLPRAIELVSTEAPSPTAEQFQRIFFEVRVGRDLTESMLAVARRMDSDDLAWLAQAVDIHRELGGNLPEILINLSGTIRERRSVHRQIEALSAEGRATGWLLLGMPVVLFLFSWWRTPENIELMLHDTTGRLLLGIAVTGMTIGHVWIRQLVRMKF